MSRLILFTGSFPYGSREQFLETEVKYLAKEFEKIQLIPLSYSAGYRRRSLPQNVEVETPILPYSDAKLEVLIEGIFNTSPVRYFFEEFKKRKVVANPRYWINWIRDSILTRFILNHATIKKILRQDLRESIFYFYWGRDLAYIVPFLKENNLPIIVRFHRWDLYEDRSGGYIPFREQILTNLTKAIFVSEHGENYLVKKYSDINFQHRVLKLGVEDHGASRSSEDGIFRMASCSYMTEIKRIDLIIEALKHTDSRIKWFHIGDGPLRTKLASLARGLPGHVSAKFLGELSNERVFDFYTKNSIDLFIDVSRSEGIPVAIMETLSCGIPVLATRVGGVPEIVDDSVGGLLKKDITPKELGKKIEQYIQLPFDVKTKYRKKARKRWGRQYTAKKNYSKFVAYLKTVSEEHKSRPNT